MKILFAVLLLLAPIVNAEQYKSSRNDSIIRLDDNANIPLDPENKDFQKYQRWLTAGNSALPVDPVPAPTKSELDVLREKISDLEKDVTDLKAKVK